MLGTQVTWRRNKRPVKRPRLKATDVYGLGAVFYQLLTGYPPFAGGTTYETIRLLLETDPAATAPLESKIDRDLSTICLRALEKILKADTHPLSRWPRTSSAVKAYEPILAGAPEFSPADGNVCGANPRAGFCRHRWSL